LAKNSITLRIPSSEIQRLSGKWCSEFFPAANTAILNE
jgi:hypothetical protein